MKNRKWNMLVYVHGILLLWALLFIGSLTLHDGGRTAGVLAPGNALFLFVNIPLAVFSFVLKRKKCFDKSYETPIVVLSRLNAMVGIAAWIFLAMLIHEFSLG